MTSQGSTGPPSPGALSPSGQEWLADVAAAASTDAQAPVDLLGDYLPLLLGAAVRRELLSAEDLAGVDALGRRAALAGVPAGRAVNLYLSATWRLWRGLPEVARSTDSETVRAAADAVLHVVSQAVAVFVDGHQDERRESIRREESVRREFIDDLLRGDADVARLVERAEPFGLDLSTSHQVALALPFDDPGRSAGLAPALERAVVSAFGDREVLVATKEGLVVVLVPADHAGPSVGVVVEREAHRDRRGGRWRIGVGRSYPGAYGIARSYEEAREALDLGQRLGLPSSVIEAKDVLVYRVLGRDQAALVDLVRAVLLPLENARGGAQPLLDTLEVYFAAGGVATEAARRLHLSVRAVTYRLDRVRALCGYDVSAPEQAFSLQAAVLGARLIGWPGVALPR